MSNNKKVKLQKKQKAKSKITKSECKQEKQTADANSYDNCRKRN
jgi:hypothetical protein